MENIFVISAKLGKTKSFQFCLFSVNFAFGIIYDIKKYNLDKDMFERHLSKFYWSKQKANFELKYEVLFKI